MILKIDTHNNIIKFRYVFIKTDNIHFLYKISLIKSLIFPSIKIKNVQKRVRGVLFDKLSIRLTIKFYNENN